MATPRRAATTLAALALVALAAPIPAVLADDPACAAVAGGLRDAREAAQDDAFSGRDAGDVQDGAVPLRNESYSWGFLDVADHAHADRVDWYSFTLPYAREHYVMVEVYATLLTSEHYVPAYQYEFHVDAFAPGATAPTHEGRLNGLGGEDLHFTPDVAGEWLFRVTRSPVASVDAPCGPAAPAPAGPVVDAGKPVADYGVYVGCEPVCKNWNHART